MIEPVFEEMPAELKVLDRWVVCNASKKPYFPSHQRRAASVTNPKTWGTFDQAQTAYRESEYDGVGFVLNGDGIAGIDLDHCVHNGQPDPKALALLKGAGCRYIELSPSGTGLHGLGYASGAAGRRGVIDGLRIELYTDKRYLTTTGRTLHAGPLAPIDGFGDLCRALSTNFEGAAGGEVESVASVTSVASVASAPSVSSVQKIAWPDRAVPKQHGQRNHCVFHVARHLKKMYPDAMAPQLKPWVEQWYQEHLDVIKTHSFAETWVDFMTALPKVKWLEGAAWSSIEAIQRQLSLPANWHGHDLGADADELLKWCVAAQIHHGHAPFFISCRQAGAVLNIDHRYANNLLNLLVAIGVLKIVQDSTTKQSRRYRMTLPPEISTGDQR